MRTGKRRFAIVTISRNLPEIARVPILFQREDFHARPIVSSLLGHLPGLGVPITCGRVRLSSDVSEIKLVFSIPQDRPTPNIASGWNAVAREAISFPAATQTSVL